MLVHRGAQEVGKSLASSVRSYGTTVRSIERHFLCRAAQLRHVPTIPSRAPIFCAFSSTPRYRPKPLPLPKRSFSERLFTSAQPANYQPLLSPISRNDLSCAHQQRRLQITRQKPILRSNNRFFSPCVSSSRSVPIVSKSMPQMASVTSDFDMTRIRTRRALQGGAAPASPGAPMPRTRPSP